MNGCFLTIAASCIANTAADEFASVASPLFNKYCVDCHGKDTQEAQLRLDQIDAYGGRDSSFWTHLYERVDAGEMPPPEADQPSEAEKQRFLKWIVDQQRASRSGATRRLNRRELSAALRELTGLQVDYTQALPGDGTINGFDTGADALQDAADSVAQLLLVTRRAVDSIRFLDPAPETELTIDLREVKDVRKAFEPWTAAGATMKGRSHGRPGMGMLLEPKWVGERNDFTIYVPPQENRKGVLRIELDVAAWKPVKGVPNPRLWIEVGGQSVDYVEITGSTDAHQQLVYEVQIDDVAIEKRGVGIELSCRVELPYEIPGFENEDRSNPDEKIPGGPGLFRPKFDRKQLPHEEQPVPFIIVQRITVNANYVAAWPPVELVSADEKLTLDDNPKTANRLLHLWAERAWRRPVDAAGLSRFTKLYQRLRAEEYSFDDALRATFQSVLLSGGFRYLASPGEVEEELAHYAIASRLSFMLWGTPPDAELLRLAAAKKLLDPSTLDAQVDRLLNDARSRGFVEPFVTQWLELGQPITITMDHIQKQDFRFARYLKESMREETLTYFQHLLIENRPAAELVESDWAMLNDILAGHYGYENVEGGEFRKVKLRADDPRGGGILGQAGIQSMLCWMGDNWVIYRGAWTLRHFLDAPPPPPPLEVPELIPSDGENRGKTFRELLKQHQNDANCSVCHKSIDPVGFAFQNFDISGRWRDKEFDSYARNELDGKIEWRGVGKSREVDATGALPRGEEFQDFQEFKSLVASKYQDDLVRGLLKNLMLYGTGRQPDLADREEIASIMESHKQNGYRLRDLMKAVVKSQAFLRY